MNHILNTSLTFGIGCAELDRRWLDPALLRDARRWDRVWGNSVVALSSTVRGGSTMGVEEFTDVSARLDSTVERLSYEFAGIFERSYIKGMVHESARQLEAASVAAFVPILTYRFARERLRAQAIAIGRLTKSATEVVFVSVTGGGRARMAASLLGRRVGETVSVHTAGSGAAAGIDPNVEIAMEEVGIDISDKFSKPLTPEVLASADLVITMGRSVGQFAIPNSARHLDWRVGDPAGADLDEVRRVREDIDRRVNALAETFETGSLPELDVESRRQAEVPADVAS